MRLSFDRAQSVPAKEERPGVKRVLEVPGTPMSSAQLQRTVQRLRLDCELINRSRVRVAQEQGTLQAPYVAIDGRIRDWMERQLLGASRYKQVYMEQSRSVAHPCGRITVETQDGGTVSLREPLPYGYFCYSPAELERGFPRRVYLAPEEALRIQEKTKFFSDLERFLAEEWSYQLDPCLGLVPFELNTRVLSACKPRFESGRLRFEHPVLKTEPEGAIRLGNPIASLDPQEIRRLLRVAPPIHRPASVKAGEAA